MTDRLFKYLFLGVMAVVIPYVTTMILIIVTLDRVEGMKLGVIPGLILPHLIFALLFIKRPLMTKLLFTGLLTAAVYGLLIITARLEIIQTNLDLYGFWDLAITNFLLGLVVWETYYQATKLVIKRST